MSVLEVYIHWATSVLTEVGGHVDGVETLQDGKVLCELIDVLDPDADLMKKVKASGDCTALAYINAALQHMSGHDIPVRFPAEDIANNDVKSMLDVLWILILNYGIHFIGEQAQNRSIGIGKKNLLEWCEEKLGTTFDPKDTLAFSLCNSNLFIKLLENVTHHKVQQLEDNSKYIEALLTQIQAQYLIRKEIIKARDIVDGTVDEHSLMIYLSLLRRRVQPTTRLSSGSPKAQPSSPTEEVRPKIQSEDFTQSVRRRASYDNPDLRSSSSKELYDQSQRNRSSDLRSGSGKELYDQSQRNRSSDLRSDPSKELYDESQRNRSSDLFSLELQFSESEKGLPKLESSRQTFLARNEAIPRDRSVDEFARVGLDSNAGKETESQLISEKETDTLSEFSSILPAGERSVSLVVSVTHPSKQSNSPSNYRTTEKTSKTYPGTIHQPNYSTSDELPTEQLNWDAPERGRREYPRAEQFRIKRPKDYIRQWEDTIDRLSAVSATDEFGTPMDPLISNYKISLPVRSKSLEAGESSHRNRQTTTSSGSHYISGQRSRSSDALNTPMSPSRGVHPHSSSIPHLQNPDSKFRATLPDRGPSGVADYPSGRYSQTPRSTYGHTQDFSSVPTYTNRPEVLTPVEDVLLSQEVYSDLPQDSITAHRTQSKQLFEANEQPALTRRRWFEPPSSGSRVRFQPHPNSLPHYEQRSLSEKSQPSDLRVNYSTTTQRVHSLSPHRQTVSSHLQGETEMGPEETFSAPASSRIPPPLHYPMQTSREPEAGANFTPRSGNHSQKTTAPTSHQTRGIRLNDFSPQTRPLSDATSGPSITEYPKEGYTFPLSNTSSQRMPFSTSFKNGAGLEFELDINYVDHVTDTREGSPPPVRRGGISRVPRREAWERDRRKREDLSSVGDRPDHVAQSIEELYNDVEVLKEKVEILEEDNTVNKINAAESTRHDQSIAARKIIDEISHMAALEKIRSSLTPGHERAFSCPLLQPSRRSKATRSWSRSTAGLGASDPKQNRFSDVTAYLDRSSKTTSNITHSNPCLKATQDFEYPAISGSNSAYKVSPGTRRDDLESGKCLDPIKLEKLKWLISRHDLSEHEISKLKQSLASVLVENDILHTKLSNFREDIHDKLKHTNGVLDDCRHHLARTQAQNMELRTAVEQEKQRSEAYVQRIKELERNLSEMKTNNEQLGNDLDETITMLNYTVNRTKPGVDALKAENSKLTSMVVNSERENYHLREEVHTLKQNQTKAINTMDDLRECLLRVRRERQELFDQLTSVQRQEQTDRVREIIHSYQEKGTQDQWEREQNLMEEARKAYLTYPGPGPQVRQECSYFTPSYKKSIVLDEITPQKSKPPNRGSFQSTPRQHFSPQGSRNDEESPIRGREIYPHRKGYDPRSKSYSPHHNKRPASTPGYCSPHSMDKSSPERDWSERVYVPKMERQKFGATNIHSSQPDLRLSYSPGRRKPVQSRPSTPHRSHTQSPKRFGNTKPFPGQHGFNRSFGSAEDLSLRPFQYTASKGLLGTRSRSRENQSAAWRNQSLYSLRFDGQDCPARHTGSHRFALKSASPERDPDNFFRSSHSPLTHWSVVDAGKQSFGTKFKRRPLHTKSDDEEITRMFQNEFVNENRRSPSFYKPKKKQWFELQSESDGEDTGINSSMSSRSSCEHTCTSRKRTPLLSDEQRRYADELIKKYTGNIPL